MLQCKILGSSCKKSTTAAKQLPGDRLAVHGPLDKTSNFQGRKRPNAANLPQTKKNKASIDQSTDAPDYTLMMKTCKVLYDDDEWYGSTKLHFPMETPRTQVKMTLKSNSHHPINWIIEYLNH